MVDLEDDDEEAVVHVDLPWYMVNGDSSGMKAWDFFMTLVQIYNMFVCPFVLVFPEVYQDYDVTDDIWVTKTSK
jgi:hypothetical protein